MYLISTVMNCKILLLLAICGATALPQDRASIQSEFDVYENYEREPDISTTEKPKSKIITVYTAADLAKYADAGDKVVLIFVTVSWCPISKEIAPIIEDIANTTDIVVIKVIKDKIDYAEAKKDWEYGVSAVKRVPVFMLVRNRKVIIEVAKTGLLSTVSELRRHGST